MHGVFASFTDIWLCELTRKVVGERYVTVAVCLLSALSSVHTAHLAKN